MSHYSPFDLQAVAVRDWLPSERVSRLAITIRMHTRELGERPNRRIYGRTSGGWYGRGG